MKRLAFGGEPELAEDSASIAQEVMLLLARGGVGGGGRGEAPRVFECKTCTRRFPSFQALGGHRASHKRPRGGGGDGAAALAAPAVKAPRAHGCAVCGVEFALGQALGGHMRRHRAAGAEAEEEVVVVESDSLGCDTAEERKPDEAKGLVGLDLNAAPDEDDAACVSSTGLNLGPLGLNQGLVGWLQ